MEQSCKSKSACYFCYSKQEGCCMLGWCSHLKGAWWGRSRDRVSVLFLLWVMITWLCSVCELLWSFTIMICAMHTFLYVHYYSVKPWVGEGGKKSRAIWIQTEKKQNYLNLKQFPLSEVRLSMNPTPNIRSSSQYAFYYFISTGLPFKVPLPSLLRNHNSFGEVILEILIQTWAVHEFRSNIPKLNLPFTSNFL